MLKNLNLQRQLSLSHFLVTLLTAFLLALFVLIGYIAYFQTGQAAKWVAFDALVEADDFADIHFDQTQLNQQLSQNFLDELYAPYWDEVELEEASEAPLESRSGTFDFYSTDQILVLDSQGRILASNHQEKYPTGMMVQQTNLTGFKPNWLEPRRSINYFNLEPLLRFAIKADQHIGFAPIVSEENRLMGWVYLSYTNAPSAAFISSTAQNLGLAFTAAALISVIISALVGRKLSRSLGKRLMRLNQLSQSYAQGDFDKRIDINGQDEISELAKQMNSMAEKLQTQMLELRNFADENARLAEEAKAFAILEERNRLARDLHDAVKQQLFGLNLSVKALKANHKKNPEKLDDQLDQITALTRHTLEEMDAIVKQLKPASLENKGLAQALQELVKQWAQQTSVTANIEVKGERELALEQEQALYRITQESLQNIAKHANASCVNLNLSYEVDKVKLFIQDNGQGFNQKTVSASSLGLKGIQERVEQLEGQFELQTNSTGTQLNISLPHAALSSTLTS